MSRNEKFWGEILTVTKEITTMQVVWILNLQYHVIFQTLLRIYTRITFHLRSPIWRIAQIFIHPISRQLEVDSPSLFHPLLGDWITDKTLHVMVDLSLTEDITFSIQPSTKRQACKCPRRAKTDSLSKGQKKANHNFKLFLSPKLTRKLWGSHQVV